MAETPDRHDRAGLPRLVIFDVDGTLQDTLSWWTELVPLGMEAFARRIGRDVPVPDREVAWSVVGRADRDIWAALLPPELQHRWTELRAVFVPMEVAQLTRGIDYLFPGTRALLQCLRAAGVRVALASNCRQPYFDAVLGGQRLGAEVDDAFCLDSPGIGSKADMVAQALRRAGTRDAVLVGDRQSDADAALAHGVPFVHRLGYLAAGELPAEAHAATQDGILEALRGRPRFLQEIETWLTPAARIGVTGPPGVGKSLLAARLGDLLDLEVVSADAFRSERPGPPPDGDQAAWAIDLDGFAAAIGGRQRCIVDGIFLEDPRIRGRLDRVLHLRASPAAVAGRLRGRDGAAAARTLLDRWWPAWRDFGPHGRADAARRVVDCERCLAPRLDPGGAGVVPTARISP